MERLTKKYDYNAISANRESVIICDCFCNNCYRGTSKCQRLKEMVEKLAEYEDLEEQGLLLKIPSKEVYDSIGDMVYYIFDCEITECTNCGVSLGAVDNKLYFTLGCDEEIFPYRNPSPEYDLDPTDWCMKTTDVPVEEWGKTVFFTRQEAEEALNKMEVD